MSTSSLNGNPEAARIELAQPEDRAALALTMPFLRNLAETGWGLVGVIGEEPNSAIVGVLVLGRRYLEPNRATLGMRLMVLKPWLETDLADRLLEKAFEAASDWGAKRIKLLENYLPENVYAKLLRKHDFVETDTFDTFELDLEDSIARWHKALDLLERRFKSKTDFEIRELTQEFVGQTAMGWALWIGGDVEENRDSITRAIAGLPGAIDYRYSRIALNEGNLVGIMLCNVMNGALKIVALAVEPKSRFSGVQMQMLVAVGQTALDSGAHVQQFEAGRLQPDTQRLARRLKAKMLESRICFEKSLADPE